MFTYEREVRRVKIYCKTDRRIDMGVLYLALKKKWFDETKSGKKKYEYRLANKYWEKRLRGKEFSKIVLTCGYPKKTDLSRRIERPWRGHWKTLLTHEEFGKEQETVFCIPVN